MFSVNPGERQVDRHIRALKRYADAIEAASETYNHDVVLSVKREARKHKRTGDLEKGVKNGGVYRRDNVIGGRILSLGRHPRSKEGYSNWAQGRLKFFSKGVARAQKVLIDRLSHEWERHFS